MSYLILFFTILPVLELALLIKVGTIIGILNTIGLTILISCIGAALARIQGFNVLNKLQENINNGITPGAELIDGALILAGGILLLIPGFITDAFGLLLLFPLTRTLIKLILKHKINTMIKEGQVVTFNSSWARPSQHSQKLHHEFKDYTDIDTK